MDAILADISRIAREKGFRLTGHAQEQMVNRKLNVSHVRDILLNPRRMVRVDHRETIHTDMEGACQAPCRCFKNRVLTPSSR